MKINTLKIQRKNFLKSFWRVVWALPNIKAWGDESLPSHLTLVKLLHVECPVPWYKALQEPLSTVHGKREPLKFVPVKFCPITCPPTTASASCTGRCRAVRALRELSSKAQCPDSRAFHGVNTEGPEHLFGWNALSKWNVEDASLGNTSASRNLHNPSNAKLGKLSVREISQSALWFSAKVVMLNVKPEATGAAAAIFSQSCYVVRNAWSHRRCCDCQPRLLCGM
jgi:hypothetical protein